MSPWLIWLIIACAFAILEMFTAGFMVIWFSVAALVALLFSLIFPKALVIQVFIWGILSIILILLTKKFADKITGNPVQTNVYSIIPVGTVVEILRVDGVKVVVKTLE